MSRNKQVFVNNWSTTISTATVAPGDTAIAIPAADSASLGALESNEYVVVTGSDGSNLEVMHVTGNDLVGNLTVERGKESTVALTFTAGHLLEARNTAGIYGAFKQVAAPDDVETKTDDYSITCLDFGKTFRMNAAVSKTLSLPSVGSVDDGGVVHAEKEGSGRLVLDAADSDYIHDSAAGGTIYSDSPFAAISLRYNHATTRWVIIAAVGVWTTT
jgi:hypothetical protein